MKSSCPFLGRICPSHRGCRARVTALAAVLFAVVAILPPPAAAQTLLNVDFGVGHESPKKGFAATGQSTNDYWNLYRHYEPRFIPGAPLVAHGNMDNLKLADGAESKVSVTLSNAPGIWGNATGDPMFDTYVFAQNGSNIVLQIRNLAEGHYHFYLYGHAEADVSPEQDSVFSLASGTNSLGPLAAARRIATRPRGFAWQEGDQYVVFRDAYVQADVPVTITVAPGPNGIAVLNGLQISSRGTRPPKLSLPTAPSPGQAHTNLLFHAIRYQGEVSDDIAHFAAAVEVEALGTNEISSVLFEGDVALIIRDLPDGVRIVSRPREYRVHVAKPGLHRIKLDLAAKITRAEPWNTVTFTGPPAAMGSITATAANAGVEMQLLRGTEISRGDKAGSRVEGTLGTERTVSLRWQGRTSEVARKSLITVDTVATAQVTPTVIKYSTQFRYDILQAPVSTLSVALPAGHTLTRLQGEQVRDWQITNEGTRSLLTVELIKPLEKNYNLTVVTEQPVEKTTVPTQVSSAQPLQVERESGSFTITSDDVAVEVEDATGLRQVNAPAGAVASYRFYGRPALLTVLLQPIQPVVQLRDQVRIRLEETRVLVGHSLSLDVLKAGIYGLHLSTPAGFGVVDVRGDGIDEWTSTGTNLHVSFKSRLIGARQIDIQLEQALKTLPDKLTFTPLRLPAATNQTAQIGASAALGIQLKTGTGLSGLREIPVRTLDGVGDEQLAFTSENREWTLVLAIERLPARVMAEVFNLVTIGDGVVGGSATIRYGLLNQGAQDFRVRVPAHWKNVDFVGPNIRRKDAGTNLWTISLQDKAWGGYTLVVTYDHQFDPKQAVIDLAGAHPLDAERETGSIAVTTAGNLDLKPAPVVAPLRVVDPTELAESDRALVSRPVLLAYKYAGTNYQLGMTVTRHEQIDLLEAVADRTQLTSVLTEEGQMLTQASFMVKNNDKQYQRFQLPADAELWGCYVNNEPIKAETDRNEIAVALPRAANRDHAFAVDIIYAQKFPSVKSRLFPKTLRLQAPRTDVPNTYAEWNLYAPSAHRLSSFGGTMTVERGTVYDRREAWTRFTNFYANVWRATGLYLGVLGGVIVLLLILVVGAKRRGWRGAAAALAWSCLLAVLMGVTWPMVNSVTDTGSSSAADAEQALHSSPPELSQQTREAPAPPGTVPAPEAAPSVQAMPTAPVASPRPAIVPQTQAARPSPAGQPMAEVGARSGSPAGLRSIRIDLPTSGDPVTFTKVLNVTSEPLALEMSVMRTKVFQIWRSAWQLMVLVVGFVIVVVQFRSETGRASLAAVGLFLVLMSVSSLLTAARILHLLLIVAPPFLLMLVAVSAVWKFALRLRAETASKEKAAAPDPVSPRPGNVPPAVAGFVLLGLVVSGSTAWSQKQMVPPTTPSTNVSIVSAVYAGAVQERIARLEATLVISAISTNELVPLFGDDIAVEEFTASDSQANLISDGHGVAARLGPAGDVTLRLKLVAQLSGDVARRRLSFGIPLALSSKLNLTIDETDANVDFPGAVAFKRSASETNLTRIEALIGAGGRVEMHWTPRTKRIAEMAASVFVQNVSLITVGGGVVNVRTAFDYQIAQGELRQLQVRLPAGQRLLRVDGESIRTWELHAERSDQILTVELLKGVSVAYKLAVETERVLEALPATLSLWVPAAQDITRETGLVGLRGGEELSLVVESADQLQRVDTAEFGKATSQKLEGPINAYRFLKPGFHLVARAEPVQPAIEATVRNAFVVGFEKVSLSAEVDYQVKKAGIFRVRLSLPAGYKLQTVSGNHVQQWHEKTNPAAVEVMFQERATGAFTLQLQLTKAHTDLPKILELAGVSPLDTHKLSGFVSVAAEPGIGIRTTSFEGLVEIPAAQLGGAKPSALSGVLAYKVVANATTVAWKLAVATEVVESWIRSEVINVIAVGDTLVNGRAVIRYDIQNAPVKEFRIRVPAAYEHAEIVGADIRRRDQVTNEWRIELQNKVRGTYQLTVTWDMPRTAATNALLDFDGVHATGVERETGFVVFTAQPPLQIREQRATAELVKIDARELPPWAGVPVAGSAANQEVPVLAYRYLRPGYRLSVEARRFQDATVLQALAESARLRTVLSDDGQMMTEITLSIRNNGLQHLEVQLPANAREVWSAFVAGQPVRPARTGNKILLPLEGTSGDTPAEVEITYTSGGKFPATKGDVELASPKFGIPLKNIRWDLYLPPDYRYGGFEGTMNYEEAGEEVIYSSVTYEEQENRKEEARRSDMAQVISNARTRLASSKLKGANEEFNRAMRLNEYNGAVPQADLEGLKKELSQVQGGNLIQAQRKYVLDNAGKFGGAAVVNGPAAVQQGEQTAAMAFYDNPAAEQQWSALQRAQEITVAKTQPLRANLPTRGFRHGFTQVLQTELNRPVTIHFEARNSRHVGWFKRIIYVVGGFVMLWVFASVVLARSGPRQHAPA